VPRDKEKHGKNSARKSVDEHRILNANPISPELLAAAIHELSINFSPSSAVLTTTVIVATITAVFSPVTGNPVNTASTTDSGNLATTPRKFVKALVKCRTSEFQSIVIFRDYHANHRRVRHGIRDQEAKKQLLQVYEHHHQ
jgi:uncharacterized membrane protein YoaK (UPF0700 family)